MKCSLFVVCLPELLENIPTVRFRFVADTEYISIFNACSIQNVEAASRVYFPLPDLSRKIERDSARGVTCSLIDSQQ